MVFSALRCSTPRACTLQDFYPGIFPPEEGEEEEFQRRPLTSGVKMDSKNKQFLGGNIQSAEQYEMLAKMGLAVDKRKR